MRNTDQLSIFPQVVARHRLPTNGTSANYPVQRWANFVAGFSVEFVLQSLEPLSRGDRVLDPFMGTGTTIVGSRLLGHHSLGYEPHPLFATLALAKASRFEPCDVQAVEDCLLAPTAPLDLSASASRFVTKLFSEEVLTALLKASANLPAVPVPLKPLAVAMFLRIAEKCCGSKTDGIYKAPTSRKRGVPFEAAWRSTHELFAGDIDSSWYKSWSTAAEAQIFEASSTDMLHVDTDTVAAVVTSPPYLNNFDFAEMTRMQLYLLGWAASWGDITSTVRGKLITNTTTALKGKKVQEYQLSCQDSLPPALANGLQPLVERLQEQRRTRKGKKDYDYLVYPYYHQIFQVLKEMHRVMRPGARVDWVVSDAALYGVYIATQEHTAVLMRAAGFQAVEITLLRPRGHRWKLAKRDGAPGKLGEYHIRAVAA